MLAIPVVLAFLPIVLSRCLPGLDLQSENESDTVALNVGNPRQIIRWIPFCDDGWLYFQPKNESIGFCYRLTRLGDCYDAERECLQANATLASIHSFEENSFLSEHNVRANFPCIGLKRIGITKEFAWSDGSSLDYSNWALGEPNNPQIEQCVQMYRDLRGGESAGEGRWNDVRCDVVTAGGFCKKRAKLLITDSQV